MSVGMMMPDMQKNIKYAPNHQPVAIFERPQEAFHLSGTAAHQAGTDHIHHIDFRDEIRKAICIVISSLINAHPLVMRLASKKIIHSRGFLLGSMPSQKLLSGI